MKLGRVLRVHQHGVSWRAVDRVDLRVNQRIELLASPSANFEFSSSPLDAWKRHGAEVRLAIWSREFPARAQVPPAILKSIARLAEVLEAIVERNHTGNLLPHFPACSAA